MMTIDPDRADDIILAVTSIADVGIDPDLEYDARWEREHEDQLVSEAPVMTEPRPEREWFETDEDYADELARYYVLAQGIELWCADLIAASYRDDVEEFGHVLPF